MKKNIMKLLITLFAVIFVISAWNIGKILWSTKETKEAYQQLKDQMIEDMDEEQTEENSDATEEGGSAVPVIVNPWLVKMQQQYPEMVAWLTIPNTDIDYPVMQSSVDTPEYYLKHDYKGDFNSHGAPFLDAGCDINTSGNLIIYGHRMKDGTMFENLVKYETAAFCESNEEICLKTPYADMYFRVLYVMTMSETDRAAFPYHTFTGEMDLDSYQDYLENCKHYALWSNSDIPTEQSQLLTLSTCEYTKNNGRLVVVAGRVK